MKFLSSARATCSLALFVACLLSGASFAQDAHTTNQFHGVKVNGGTVMHSKQGDRNILTLSDDFKSPETPDPHWQGVDSKGNVYTLVAAAAPAIASSSSCCAELAPLTPTPPMIWSSSVIGIPPMSGVKSSIIVPFRLIS